VIPWWTFASVVGFETALYVFLAFGVWPRSPRQRFQQAVRKRVVVHTHSGHSLDGVLAGLYSDGVALEHATFLRSGEPSIPLEGAQLVPWQGVDWVQELNARSEDDEGT
jgi:hypothetical protein